MSDNNKELRPIGTVFSTIHPPDITSTDSHSHKHTYKVVAHRKDVFGQDIATIECINIEEVDTDEQQ